MHTCSCMVNLGFTTIAKTLSTLKLQLKVNRRSRQRMLTPLVLGRKEEQCRAVGLSQGQGRASISEANMKWTLKEVKSRIHSSHSISEPKLMFFRSWVKSRPPILRLATLTWLSNISLAHHDQASWLAKLPCSILTTNPKTKDCSMESAQARLQLSWCSIAKCSRYWSRKSSRRTVRSWHSSYTDPFLESPSTLLLAKSWLMQITILTRKRFQKVRSFSEKATRATGYISSMKDRFRYTKECHCRTIWQTRTCSKHTRFLISVKAICLEKTSSSSGVPIGSPSKLLQSRQQSYQSQARTLPSTSIESGSRWWTSSNAEIWFWRGNWKDCDTINGERELQIMSSMWQILCQDIKKSSGRTGRWV